MQEEGNLLQLAAAILGRPASTAASASGSETSSAATVAADKAAAETEDAAASSAEASRAPAPPMVASQPQTFVQVTSTGTAAITYLQHAVHCYIDGPQATVSLQLL